jgi:hypothetical protein
MEMSTKGPLNVELRLGGSKTVQSTELIEGRLVKCR